MPDFERAGVALFAVSYDSVSVLSAFATRHGITYPLLSDEGSHVIRRLGLLNDHLVEMASKGVPYIERDVATDEQAMEELSRLGYMTTPVTKIDGEVVVGFNRRRLEDLLS